MTDGRDSIRQKYRPLSLARGLAAIAGNYIDADLMNTRTFMALGLHGQILRHDRLALRPLMKERGVRWRQATQR